MLPVLVEILLVVQFFRIVSDFPDSDGSAFDLLYYLAADPGSPGSVHHPLFFALKSVFVVFLAFRSSFFI